MGKLYAVGFGPGGYEHMTAKAIDVIKNAVPSNATTLNNVNHNCVSVSNLREDVVIESSAMEKQIILENFPNKKNGFLVVAKVIEG